MNIRLTRHALERIEQRGITIDEHEIKHEVSAAILAGRMAKTEPPMGRHACARPSAGESNGSGWPGRTVPVRVAAPPAIRVHREGGWQRMGRPDRHATLPVSEAELQRTIIGAAEIYGWLVSHFRPALTGKGWRTPVQGDVGFPDLVLVRPPRLIFAELKSDAGRLSEGQREWISRLSETALAFQIGREPALKPRFEVEIVSPATLDGFLVRLR